MKFLRISFAALAAALISAGVVDAAAQSAQAGADAQVTIRPSGQAGTEAAGPQTAAAQASAQEDAAVTDRYLTSVQAELTSKLDSKNAAVGQEVDARTTQPATLADGTALPKGTRLVGHVARVQAQTNDQPYAVLAITFDHAELKGGQSVALRSVIRTVAPPVHISAKDSPMDVANGPLLGGASAGGMSSASTRGGAGLGGAVGGPVRGVGQTAGTTLGGMGTGVGSVAGPVPDRPGGVVGKAGETVSAAPRATELAGVMLSNSTDAAASGTLTAAGGNIQLNSGTQITMGVITR